MQLSIFHLQDQPDLMVKYDVVTETLLTDQLQSLPLLTATSDGVSCLLLLTKGGILAVTLYRKNKSCTLNPLSKKIE